MASADFAAAAARVRVVLTCDWFLKYASAQAAGLARAGAEVLLLCRTHAREFADDGREREATLEIARGAGVRVLEIPGRMSDVRVTPRLLALRREVVRFRPEVAHAHEGADPRALALLAGIPTVLTVHDPVLHPGQPVPVARKRWFLRGSRDMWRARARTIVVHSERLRREVPLRAGQRCYVVPHGAHVAAEPLPPPPSPAVAFFGRLEPYKGLDVLARAMPRVWVERPNVHLRVAGAGSSEIPIADPRVEVSRRYLPEAELQPFFAASSLAVLPYTQASQSGAGSVAAGYGVPIVASRLGGLPDLVLDDSYLVEPGDEVSLAGAILAHVDDGLAVRRRVLDEVASRISWDAVARASLEIYAEAAARR